MIINDGTSGKSATVTNDGSLRTISIVQTDINALAALGTAWTLPFTVTAADTTDNVVFHVNNTASLDLEFMRIIVSSAIGGLWTIESGRTYSSGGTAVSLRQLKIASGKTQDMTAYYGADITLAGTASDIFYVKTAANEPFDLLNYGPVVVTPSSKMAIKFKADSGTPVIAVTSIVHGENPWG